MPTYAVEVGRMIVTSDKPISAELRVLMLKAVREALENMDGSLGYEGFVLKFEPKKD